MHPTNWFVGGKYPWRNYDISRITRSWHLNVRQTSWNFKMKNQQINLRKMESNKKKSVAGWSSEQDSKITFIHILLRLPKTFTSKSCGHRYWTLVGLTMIYIASIRTTHTPRIIAIILCLFYSGAIIRDVCVVRIEAIYNDLLHGNFSILELRSNLSKNIIKIVKVDVLLGSWF